MDKLSNRNNHRKCAKCGKTRAEDMSVTYHRFPKPGIINYYENVTKARAWAKYCWPNNDWSSLDSLKSLHIQNKVLCGRHFHSSQFYDSERQKLNKFAVPESSEVEELLRAREINFDQNIKQTITAGQSTTRTPLKQIENTMEPSTSSHQSFVEFPSTSSKEQYAPRLVSASTSATEDRALPSHVTPKKNRGILKTLNVTKISQMTTREVKLYRVCQRRLKEIMRLRKLLKKKRR